jgi:hypothetical protein
MICVIFLLIWMVCLSNCLGMDFEDIVSCNSFCCRGRVTFEGFLDDVVTSGSLVVITSSATVFVVVVVVAVGSNSCSFSCSPASFLIRSSTYDTYWYLSSLSNLLRRIDKA